ncbi:threonine synthase [Arenimonas sp.]|uniref:threonine synthase n=1 Tax=Arenimonas sp. TaxID=1872635 RepID=UPI0039E2E98F
MKYVSTRGTSPAVGLSATVSAGLAPDGGLYVPQHFPRRVPADFNGLDTLPEIASRLLQPFFEADALASDLDTICAQAFDFPAPLRELSPLPPGEGARRAGEGSPSNDLILELFHGPTAAFKDFGARFLAACLQRLQRDASRPLTIIVATSGDTGAAVAGAFHRLPGLRVVVLYPDGRVSPRQAHQLGCYGDNVFAFRVAGSFDDCQRLAKQALNDHELQRSIPLSSANSISLGRLLPQMSYYAASSLAFWCEHGEPLNFVVPTGNLGNAFAAMLARALGLPIGRIALATNANRVLPDFFAGGEYAPQASLSTLANAMDVGAPSNFERLRWLYPDEARLRDAFAARAISDETIRETIRELHARIGETICPHTATAVSLLQQLRREGESGPWAIAATAHPAKFESIVEPLIGREVPVPPALATLLARPARAEPLPADYAALCDSLNALPG